jgi:inosine-uridine nucleoside N-ribohydrolase
MEKKEQPVSLIFDTDMAPDYDDVGALAILHAMADSGEVKILATVSSNLRNTAVPCIEVLNTYFGRPDIPLGAVKGNACDLGTWHKGLKWTEELPEKYLHRTKSTADSEDATNLYRRVLSAQPDTSVTIVTTGFLSNLKNLLLSRPDNISPLSGDELVRKKVNKLVSMAGIFPEGHEFNVHEDSLASQIVFEKWPTPIILSGFEIGVEIFTGAELVKSTIENNPVIDTYKMCLQQDDPKGRMSWDQTAVLVGVRGTKPYFDTERGKIIVFENGSNSWETNPLGKHERLIFKMPKEELTKTIENMMLHQPKKKK